MNSNFFLFYFVVLLLLSSTSSCNLQAAGKRLNFLKTTGAPYGILPKKSS